MLACDRGFAIGAIGACAMMSRLVKLLSNSTPQPQTPFPPLYASRLQHHLRDTLASLSSVCICSSPLFDPVAASRGRSCLTNRSCLTHRISHGGQQFAMLRGPMPELQRRELQLDFFPPSVLPRWSHDTPSAALRRPLHYSRIVPSPPRWLSQKRRTPRALPSRSKKM
jgi:hypothetical protein